MSGRQLIGMIVFAVAVASAGCEFETREVHHVETEVVDTTTSGSDTMGVAMMHDTHMMRAMMQDTTTRRTMMHAMMQDTMAMRMMMIDSSMARMMTENMATHPDLMRTHMRTMLNNPQHRAAMLQVVREDSLVREHLRDVLAEAGATE